MNPDEATLAKQTSLNESGIVEAVLDLARGGWPVFPVWWPMEDGRCACGKADCDSPAKHPIGDLVPHGLKDASCDKALIRAWWKKYPSANIGLRTGSESGIAVVDLDGDAELLTNKLGRNGITWGDTPTSRTGGGGRHVFLAHPGGNVPTKAAILTLSSVNGAKPAGVDIRGDGGYVVAPPSSHVSGRRYVWERDPASTELAPFPTGLLHLIRASTTPRLLTPASPGESWVVTALRGPIGEGVRNATATKLAGFYLPKMGNDSNLVVAHLNLWAKTACVPPMDLRELRRTVESIASAERAQVPLENLSDLGNAKRLISIHGNDLRYVGRWGRWLYWQGYRWGTDDTGESVRRAKDTISSMYADAASIKDEEARKALIKHLLRSESASHIRGMVSLAETEAEIAITPDRLDSDGWSLNCLNGTIDLRAGTLGPHRRGDLITKVAPVHFDPSATCPIWESFLHRVMGANTELVSYLQRLTGYALTADVSEQGLDILYGTGANGKTTWINTVIAMLGDYAKEAAPRLLVRKYGETHPTEVADLFGTRFVASVEVDQGGRLDEVLVKQLTGGDVVKGRFMREDFFQFLPTWKLVVATNHKPVIRGTDHAIWRRIRMVPFSVTIPEAEQDRSLGAKLKAELGGILAWAVRGCLEWQEQGLCVPQEVKVATETYRSEMDWLVGFLDECCLIAQGGRVLAKDLYSAYGRWCEANGEKPKSQRDLGTALRERGFERRKGNKGHAWVGLEVKHDP